MSRLRKHPDGILNDPRVDALLIAVEELARATDLTKTQFVEPAHGTLDRAKAKRHHIIFGRRGAGKTSLLLKAAADLTVDRRPIAVVNLESFKGLTYPDVLLSVLIKSLEEFKQWFESAATARSSRLSFWKKLFGTAPSRPPLNKERVEEISSAIELQLSELRRELHNADTSSIRTTLEATRQAEHMISLRDGVKVGPITMSDSEHGKAGATKRSETVEEARRTKIDFLHRHVLDYQKLFRQIATVSDGDAFLFLDDLYHIRKDDQAQLLDYVHRIGKGNRLWLKVGTIRHRTLWYRHADPPIGVKLGDDIDEIDLDFTLEKFNLTKTFLVSVLSQVARSRGIDSLDDLLAKTAIDRLVLASGGVARDFLQIFRRAVQFARERQGGARGVKVAATDVNQAAGEYESSKRDELQRDAEEREQVEGAFDRVRAFCLERMRSNCFLIPKDAGDPESGLINELVDLRLLHHVNSRVTIPDRPGDLFVAFMLDLGQYTGERKRRGLEIIPFWRGSRNERLRRTSLVYDKELAQAPVEESPSSKQNKQPKPTSGVAPNQKELF